MHNHRIPIVPPKDLDLNNIRGELEHVYLSMLLWQDVWLNRHKSKYCSKYFKYVENMNVNSCPLCVFHLSSKNDCVNCPLGDCCENDSLYQKLFYTYNRKYAYYIYLRIYKHYTKLKSLKGGK